MKRLHFAALGALLILALGATVQQVTKENVKDWTTLSTPALTNYFLGLDGSTAKKFLISATPISGSKVSGAVAQATHSTNADVAVIISGVLDPTNLPPVLVVTGTTNQVAFGATNTPPSDAVNILKWISVSVTGETNEYRLPLYQ